MEQGTNKSYRIRTNINEDSNVLVNFTQEYETFELLSIKLKTENLYRLHNANYGIVVGRVQANGGFGVPNAKISIFIEVDQENENSELLAIYGYTDVFETNSLGNTYNLLPDEQVSDCHKKIGAFPSKRYLLDNDTYIEVYDKYYKYTTRTNNAGDYIIVGVPIGNQTLHMDLDLSDCGILSQRPRDFVYKGYNIEQFDNPNQFKSETGASINFLSQYVQQTKTVYVNPLWGNNELGETLGITRADIDVNFKFEPTCVFMGSVISDSKSNGISMKCVPTDQMGVMDELTTGKGTIEMIRKTPTNGVEEFQIKGNELIDGNGTWCYQIPMNLDYITTNEYGETVATDNPNIGIPTRARVRFRVSLDNFEESNDSYFAGKVLVPNNPKVVKKNGVDSVDYDYVFGTETGDDSYRDLFWNNVYTVKQHIPRIQKSGSWRTDRFTGIKQCNFYGQNNPIPYNSIRIKLPFMFVVLCAIIKTYVRIVAFLNAIINAFFQILTVFLFFVLSVIIALLPVICIIYWILDIVNGIIEFFGGDGMDLTELRELCYLDVANWAIVKQLESTAYITIADGICPDLESWYFAPALLTGKKMKYCFEKSVSLVNYDHTFNLCEQTIDKIENDGESYQDSTSTDSKNKDTGEKICITRNLDYLMTCIEMNLAQEYKVIKFDFYNDWINGMLYIPRWKFRPEHKITFLFGLIKFKVKTKGCFDDNSIFGRTRWLTQHCALGYAKTNYNGGYKGYSKIATTNGCSSNKKKQKCHKNPGIRHTSVFGENGGMIHRETTMVGQTVYYYKPSEMSQNDNGKQTKINMFATDIVLLGSLKDCDENGVPQSFKWLSSSSYKMPTNLALTNLDEAGVLFVDGDSYCRGGNSAKNIESKQVGLGGNSFAGQIDWSSNAPTEVQIMGYDPKSPNYVGGDVKIASDRIAMTEAAGISWDYTGPSQADPSDDNLFTPGGHFLGMSCVNSKTNIKSCVNLQRICEAGATMSERIEKTREFKENNDGTYKQLSSVFSPTGFISTDEIIAGSFRNMFATMNLTPLIASKKDKNTGYLTYDFTYIRANGFDGGAANNIVSKSGYYNANIKEFVAVVPEDQNYDSGDVKYDDIDPDEYRNTFHRSIEAVNFGYYRFRFGLKDSDKTKFNEAAESKYAFESGSTKYLPQYENSFYFYFGLKDGNTAIDRFYSDFFSMCPTRQQGKNPSFTIKDAGMDYCTKEQSVWVTCDDIEFPYDLTLTNNGLSITANGITYKTVNVCGLTPGEWNVNVTDSEGFSVSKKVKIGSSIKGIDYKFDDFREMLATAEGNPLFTLKSDGSFVSTGATHARPNGGEFSFNVDNITVFGQTIQSLMDVDEDKKKLSAAGLLFVSSDKVSPSSSDKAVMLIYKGNNTFIHNQFVSGEFYNSSVVGKDDTDRHRTDFEFGSATVGSLGSGAVDINSGNITFHMWGDKKYYTLYFIYKCTSLNGYLAMQLAQVYSNGYETFNIYLGSKFLKYNGKNTEGFSLSDSTFSITSGTTLSDILSKINSVGNDVTQWALRQALFDQRYDITLDSSDRMIRCTNLRGNYIDAFTFGQPEKAMTQDGVVSFDTFKLKTDDKVFSTDDYAVYPGYEVDDTASLLGSSSVVPGEDVKLPYFKMTYDSGSGLILSKSFDVKITGITSATASGLEYTCLECSKTGTDGNGYILKSKEDETVILQCTYSRAYGFIIPSLTISNNGFTLDQISEKEFSVYPTLCIPVIHKPFYFEAHPFILGQFTVLGNTNLTTKVKCRGEVRPSWGYLAVTDDNSNTAYTMCTYGDRDLKYKVVRDSSKENEVYINDYIRIYGGNACAPDYYLSKDCKHFGQNLEEEKDVPIRIPENITGSSADNRSVDKLCRTVTVQPDTVDISLSTGLPSTISLNKLTEKEREDLTAFTGGDMKGLQSTTSYSIDNMLPKEIVIRKKRKKEEGVDEKTALVQEEKYLDVGEADSVTANDVNENVKLYMIVIPDTINGNTTEIGKMMGRTIFNENKLFDTYSDGEAVFHTVRPWYVAAGSSYRESTYPVKTAKELFSGITFSDYFSNPSAVAFLFDQVIQSSCYSYLNMDVDELAGGFNVAYHGWPVDVSDIQNGRQRCGYFYRTTKDNFKDPGLIFGYQYKTYDYYNLGWLEAPIYNLSTPFNGTAFSPYKAFDGKAGYENFDGNAYRACAVYRTIYGGGSVDNASIEKCLTDFKHGGISLSGAVQNTNLCKGLSNFGYEIKLTRKFDTSGESNYPTEHDTVMALVDTLSEKYGLVYENEESVSKKATSIINYIKSIGTRGWGASHTPYGIDWFDKIIGRNWASPNLEYSVSDTNSKNSAGYCKDFSDMIEAEYERVYDINKGKADGEALEEPDYANIIANFFIKKGHTAKGSSEIDTLRNLFEEAKNGHHESFILPVRLGPTSPFIWPYSSSDGNSRVYRDRKWVVNSETEWALGHSKGSSTPMSSIEDSIFDENLSYGFRSVIIGIYNGHDTVDTEEKTGNKIRPFKIYTFHSKGLFSTGNYESKISSTHERDTDFKPNEYHLKRVDPNDPTKTRQITDKVNLYYYHGYENGYDGYASGWC